MKLFIGSRPKILLFSKFLTKLAQKRQFIKQTLKYSTIPYKHEIGSLRFGKIIDT